MRVGNTKMETNTYWLILLFDIYVVIYVLLLPHFALILLYSSWVSKHSLGNDFFLQLNLEKLTHF